MSKDTKIKYFLYARKSTEGEDRQVASIGDQIKAMKKIAIEKGLEIVEIFEESKSAKNLGRPIFNEMIQRIIKGEASGIICWKADRLARNMIDGGLLIDILSKGQIAHIQAYDAEYKSQDNVLFLAIAFGFSTQYSKDLAVNVKRGMTSRAERGWFPNHAPAGYKSIRKSHKAESIVVKDSNFILVRKLFDKVLKTQCSIYDLCNYSKELGLKTSQGNDIKGSTMYNIVKNPFYYGRFEWPANSGNWYTGKHEPMISLEEHTQIQATITRKTKKKTGYKEIDINYRGLMTCKSCGGAVTASKVKKVQKNGNKHEYIYYHYSKTKDRSCTQKSKAIREEELEKQTLEILDRIEIPEIIHSWAVDKLKEEDEQDHKANEEILNQHKLNLQKEEKKISNLIDMRAEGEISKEDYSKKVKKYQKSKNQIESIINNLENGNKDLDQKVEDTFSFAVNLKTKFKNGTSNEKKDILQNLDSNLFIEDRKLLVLLDLRLQPFKKYSQPLKQELARLKPLKLTKHYNKVGTLVPTCSSRWAEQDSNLRRHKTSRFTVCPS